MPEHSLLALQKAAADALPVIEVDLRASRDGVPVLFHDRHIKELKYLLPKGAMRVRTENLLSNELRRVCYREAPSQCIVPFSDALEIFRSSSATILIDPKQGDTPGLLVSALSIAVQAGMLDRLIVLCSPINECLNVDPKAKLMLRAFSVEELQKATDWRPYAVQIDESLLATSQADAARHAGIRVMVKTLSELGDSPAHWQALSAAGANDILTDYPRKFLAQGCR